MDNEIAEMLLEASIKTAFPLQEATLDDIVEVQEALLIHIPPDFRDYLLQCSHVIYGQYEPVTVSDANSHTYLPEVAAEAWAQGMPRDLIPLCQIDQGFYCVGEDGVVYFWQAATDDAKQVAEHIWDWVKEVWLGAVDPN